jgi:allophanate hydrolase
VAVPAGQADGGHFGVSLLAPAFHDAVVADLAAVLEDAEPVAAHPFCGQIRWGPAGMGLVVVGAHLSGLPLNAQLTASGARLLRAVRTAPSYRLHALDTQPPKPGLVLVPEGGAGIEGELWQLSAVALAELLSSLPQPMALGPVELEDGSTHAGFLCQPWAVDGAADITDFGGWRAYVAATGKARS